MNETPQQYAQRVVGYLEGRDPVEVLASTPRELQKLIKGASKRKLGAKPVPDGWSAAMILGHMADTEIVYAFRLRLMLGTRGITIQGIDQDAWAVIFDYSTQDAVASVEDFRVNRERTIRMLKNLSKQQWDCYGMHTERGKETVRRAVELLAGHDINHMRQIRAILGK